MNYTNILLEFLFKVIKILTEKSQKIFNGNMENDTILNRGS